MALPAVEEESAPSFSHHDSVALPLVSGEGKTVRLITGSAYGERSPVATVSETLFADVMMASGSALPVDPGTEERAIYLVSGDIDIAGVELHCPLEHVISGDEANGDADEETGQEAAQERTQN